MKIKGTCFIILLLAVLVAACSSDPISGSGSLTVGNKSIFLLPPGHPGNVVGDTIMLPEEDSAPAVRTAYCFPGVANAGDFGIGSLIGEIDIAMLPVNINAGSTTIGSYSVTVTLSDPSVAIDPDAVAGSRSFLSTGTCADRGCPNGCQDVPANFPNLYSRAPGFEAAPVVAGDSVSITLTGTDASLTPASGIFNLANIPIRIVDTLPYGGVDVVFTVNYLRDRLGNNVAYTPAADGLIIKKFRIVYD